MGCGTSMLDDPYSLESPIMAIDPNIEAEKFTQEYTSKAPPPRSPSFPTQYEPRTSPPGRGHLPSRIQHSSSSLFPPNKPPARGDTARGLESPKSPTSQAWS
eukprot:TRINITY_DN35233_c0_g1_i1.p1 TRINITY_DN35233_c0_g1~~TRINITY_DN35233_c0_g1_i1.p1  ORF type:complete len:102 (+),score=12.21 TRINITY_DN35233_c0_g1_i1:84-389(+)